MSDERSEAAPASAPASAAADAPATAARHPEVERWYAEGDSHVPAYEPEPAAWRMLLAGGLILGLMAAVVFPLIIDERQRAQDEITKAQLTSVTNAISLYVTQNNALPELTVAPDGTVLVGGQVIVTLAEHVELGPLRGDVATWCIDARNDHGEHAKAEGYRWDQKDDKVDRGLCP